MRRSVLVFLVFLSMVAGLPARADEVGTAIGNARGSALAVDGAVDAFAQAAAQRIASSQSLGHSNLGSLLGTCTAVGEVIGYGPDVPTVMKGFAGSSGHWTTINQSKWNAMGTGLAVDSAGVLWVSVVFCTLANGPGPAPPPATAQPPTPPPPLPPQTQPVPAPTPPAPVPDPVVPAPTPSPAPATTAPIVSPPEIPDLAIPVVAIPVQGIVGPFITTDGAVSMLMGASPFVDEELWRIFRSPSIS